MFNNNSFFFVILFLDTLSVKSHASKDWLYQTVLFWWCSLSSGEDEEQLEQLMESVGFEEEDESLKCFRCDLGFWDTCYTTEINCSHGERCFTGRGKAGVMNKTVFLVSVGLTITI